MSSDILGIILPLSGDLTQVGATMPLYAQYNDPIFWRSHVQGLGNVGACAPISSSNTGIYKQVHLFLLFRLPHHEVPPQGRSQVRRDRGVGRCHFQRRRNRSARDRGLQAQDGSLHWTSVDGKLLRYFPPPTCPLGNSPKPSKKVRYSDTYNSLRWKP